MPIPWDVLLGAAFIFMMRICDVTIGTIRVIFLTRGQKYYAAALGFVEVTIFLVAISQVLRHDNSILNIVAYAGGFAMGNIVGVSLEERIALGFTCIKAFSSTKGDELSKALRDADFGVTETVGQGRDGIVYIVETAVHRRDAARVHKIVRAVDTRAFVVTEQCSSIFQGYVRPGK